MSNFPLLKITTDLISEDYNLPKILQKLSQGNFIKYIN